MLDKFLLLLVRAELERKRRRADPLEDVLLQVRLCLDERLGGTVEFIR